MKRNLSSEQQLFVSLFFFSERQGSRESSNQHDSSLFPLRSTHTHEHVGAHNVLDFNCISLGFVTYRRTQVRGLFRAPKEKEKKKKSWQSVPANLASLPHLKPHHHFFFFLFRSWISRPIFFFSSGKSANVRNDICSRSSSPGGSQQKKKTDNHEGPTTSATPLFFPFKVKKRKRKIFFSNSVGSIFRHMPRPSLH